MYSINLELADLKEKISEKTTHSFVKNQIDKPIIDLDKLFVLNELYQNTSMSRSQKQDYIVIIMLIEIALKTHDLVNGNNYKKETDKQLTVLVGDYYSGMYYYLLSELENVKMIKVLAASIKKINEEKMKLHYNESKSEEEVYEALLNSETHLFTEVAKFNSEYEAINLIKSFLMLNRLKKEQLDKDSILYNYYKKNELINTDYSINERIELKINELKKELDSSVEKLSSNYSHYIYKHTLDSVQTNIPQTKEG